MTYKSQYFILRESFLEKRPRCEAKLDGCTYFVTEIHHKISRNGIRLIMEQYFLPTCHNCHEIITRDSKQAIEKGLSLPRGSKEVTGAVREFKNKYEG